ncbi:hypothetical protein WICMUC_001305 [Wickerhamomyces mucosus]|uniref:Sister chromatid cohesion protein PDS5 n=1 Tax=Wickerhamomyces mucosus TaxID=1378264 RepID=A0A9P8THH6_9ASCO|nr:hypothetical protein WICMUC_001305 [Wickerhamomyces mucosus]
MTVTRYPRLKFNKSIISSPKENIPLKELLERLDIDQENFDTRSLDRWREDLINKKLIHHKEIGVQSLVACCISDILRVYAPDAPYTDRELTDIFKLFIKQFKYLSDIENGFYSQNVYLITRLAEVRSIILVTDIDNGAELIENIFQLFFDVSNKFNKKLEPIISDILSEIIAEWDSITTSVLKLILNKFLANSTETNTISSSLSSSNYALPFNFAKTICEFNPDRLARQLTKFFSEVLYENSNVENSSAFTTKNLIKIHKLTIELWKHVPEILGSVMGLIDDELNADDEQFRILATETLGQIIASNSKFNFVTVHKETWIAWMKKTLDISPNVRSKWVEQASEVLLRKSDISTEIINGLSKTLIDTDEKVRLATVKAISKIPPKMLLQKIQNNKSILNGLTQLIREKHIEVRKEAILILGDLFNGLYDEIFKDGTELTGNLKLVSQIPHNLLSLYYINDNITNYYVDLVLIEKILPLENDEVKRVQRLLNVVSMLDSKSKQPFFAFNRRQQELSSVFTKFIGFAESNNANGEKNEQSIKLNKTINWFAVKLPGDYNPIESLQRFTKVNNRRLFYLLKLCISNDSDYETLKNSTKEFFTRIQDSKIMNSIKGELNVSMNDIYQTFKILIYRSSLIIYNRSNIQTLLKLSNNSKYHKIAEDIIDNISMVAPFVFQNQLEDLVNLVKNCELRESEDSKVNTLKALFNIYQKFPKFIDINDRVFINKILEFAQEGTPLEAENAVKIINLTTKKDELSTILFDNIYPLDIESVNFASNLSVIANLFLINPIIVEDSANALTAFLIKNVLLTNLTVGNDNDPSWVDEEDLDKGGVYSNLNAKIYAIRVFTNRLQSLTNDIQKGPDGKIDETTKDFEPLKAIAENVLKLLGSLISNGGEIVSSKSATHPTPKHFQSRLRLEAGLNLLELAKYPEYNNLIKASLLERLVLLIQDENENVRSVFIYRLTSYLKSEDISFKFLPLVYLIAFEPDSALKLEVKTWIKSSFSKSLAHSNLNKPKTVFEVSLAGLIYYVSHHSEFTEYLENKEDDDSMLKAFSFALEYIAFFLDTIATEQNVSMLYYLATRVKQYKDNSFSDDDSEKGTFMMNNIYKISDLAQMAIKELQDQKGWTLQSYPAKVSLTTELFRPISNTEEAHNILSTSYIPDSILKNLKSIVKNKITSLSIQKRARQQVENHPETPKVKKGRILPAKKERRVYRRRTFDDDDDDKDDDFRANVKNSSTLLRKSSRAKRVSYAQTENEDGEIEESDINSNEDVEDED